MSVSSAALVAMTASWVTYLTITVWYVIPAIRRIPPEAALVPLLWLHVFRYIALQLFSAQAFGFEVPDAARNEIAYGDLAGAALAFVSLVALRYRSGLATVLVWIFVAATVVDLTNAFLRGVRDDLFDTATDVSWMILIFYVPALWISVALVVWQQLRARREGAVAA